MLLIQRLRRHQCRLRSVLLLGLVVFAEEAKSGGRDAIRREAQMAKNVLARRRRSEALHTNDRALVARPAMPSYRWPGLHRDTFPDGSRKDAFTVRTLLGLEQAPARHTDYARLYSEILQLLPRRHTEAD